MARKFSAFAASQQHGLVHGHGALLQDRDRVGLLDSSQMATPLFSTDFALILFFFDSFLALFRSHRLELEIECYGSFCCLDPARL